MQSLINYWHFLIFFCFITVCQEYVSCFNLKLCSLLYLSCTFQSKVGYLSVGPIALGTACTPLLLSAGHSASLLPLLLLWKPQSMLVLWLAPCSVWMPFFLLFLSPVRLNLRLLYASLPCFYLCIFKSSICETLLLLMPCNVIPIGGS